MTVYIIRGEVVTARTSAPAKGSQGEVVIGSAEEIAASPLSLGQMVVVWNALPGTTAITKFKDRKTAVQRLWTAFTQLPVDPEPTAGPIKLSAGSKQAQVIGLLQRPQGATVDEIATVMGWQRHTVRGLISGALKKKLGLQVISEKSERGRLYRIPAEQPAS